MDQKNLINYLKNKNCKNISKTHKKQFVIKAPHINEKEETNLINKFANFVEQHSKNNNYQFYVPRQLEDESEDLIIKILTKSIYTNKDMLPLIALNADFDYYLHIDKEAWFGHVIKNFEDNEENLEKLKNAYINLTKIEPDVDCSTCEEINHIDKNTWQESECLLFKNKRYINIEKQIIYYLKETSENYKTLRKHLIFKNGELIEELKDFLQTNHFKNEYNI